jgi:hypothetical protein
MEVSDHFRLSSDARTVLRDVTTATNRWRTAAQAMGLSRAAMERMALAFEHDQADAAQEIVGPLIDRP